MTEPTWSGLLITLLNKSYVFLARSLTGTRIGGASWFLKSGIQVTKQKQILIE
jgi:hypothetical protein